MKFRRSIYPLDDIPRNDYYSFMTRRLQPGTRPTRPFASLEEKVFLEILRTSQVASRWIAEALRTSELSAPQFNVLRILRGAGPGGLQCGQIAERMVTHDPDLTRLLDRLEARGMVAKTRDTKDRRVVNACITKDGLAAVVHATRDVQARLREVMKPIDRAHLEQLAEMLETVRAGVNETAEEQQTGGSHGNSGSRAGHRGDRAPGRSSGERADRKGRAGARDDAQTGVGRGKGAGGARRRDRQG
jgi:DNA-binding MarR family transcriptional regulator